MAGLTTKGVYGLAAMHVLARAPGGRAMQIREIAAVTDISHAYLEQLLPRLRHAGLLQSRRGASGGYLLARTASQITVLEILEVLEGDLCHYEGPIGGSGALELFWDDTHRKMRELFKLSLDDIDRYLTADHYAI